MNPKEPQPELVRETIASVDEAHPPGRVWPVLVAALVVAASAAALIWKNLESDPLTRMAPAERYQLYLKTLDHFARICEPAQVVPGVTPLCADEADLLRRFPDCEEACRDRTAGFAHERPTR